MRVKLGLVAENTDAYLNQVQLLLFSLRKNGGSLKDIPVVLITNNEPLEKEDQDFLQEHFAPIEFKTMPRLGGTPHVSKHNVFFGIDPESYDVLLFMDCDTVIVRPLDDIIDPIKNGAEFVCRRGGKTDRNRFVNFDSLVARYGGEESSKVDFDGKKEFPMFNSGVFLATPQAVLRVRHNAIECAYDLYDRWLRRSFIENTPFIKYLYRYKVLRSKKDLIEEWPVEEGALALACIRSGVKVEYLSEVYNSWGNLPDLRVLHCFKSAYPFDRKTMFTSSDWVEEYKDSDVPGKKSLARIVEEYKDKFHNDK